MGVFGTSGITAVVPSDIKTVSRVDGRCQYVQYGCHRIGKKWVFTGV